MAVFRLQARNVSLSSCGFAHLGGVYALAAHSGSHGVTIENCSFVDVSGGAVKLGSTQSCANDSRLVPAGWVSRPGRHPGACNAGRAWGPPDDLPEALQDKRFVVTNNVMANIPVEYHGANGGVFAGYVTE